MGAPRRHLDGMVPPARQGVVIGSGVPAAGEGLSILPLPGTPLANPGRPADARTAVGSGGTGLAGAEDARRSSRRSHDRRRADAKGAGAPGLGSGNLSTGHSRAAADVLHGAARAA